MNDNPYNHPKNITVGNGRVIWGQAIDGQPEGWVLPGGEHTTDEDRARAVAHAIHAHSVNN